MNRNKGKITLSLAIAATLTLTSATAFADTNTENSLHETSITKNVSTQGERTAPSQEQFKEERVVDQPLKMQVMGSETTTGSAVKLVTSAILSGDTPVQTAYVVGQPLQDNLVLDVTYDDNSTEQVPVTPDMFKLSDDGSTFNQNFTTAAEYGNAVYIAYDGVQRGYMPLVVVHPKTANIVDSSLQLSNSEITRGTSFIPEGKLSVQYSSVLNNYTCDYPLTEQGLSINTSSVNTEVAGQYPVTYSFGGNTGTTYVQVVDAPGEKYITNVELDGIKTDYIKEQDFTPQGNFKVTYSDATTELVPIGLEHLQFLSTNVIGNGIDARVTYAGRILSYKINVIEKSVASISIDQDSPLRTTYTVGTPLTTTGAQIVVNWDNGKNSKEPLTTDMVTGYNQDQLGSQTLTVTHEGITTTFNVTVIETPAKIEPVSLQLVNPETGYYKGQQLTVYNATVTYNDGHIEDVLLLPDAVTGYDANVLGQQEVTFSYTSDDNVTVTKKLNITVSEDHAIGINIPYNYTFVLDGIDSFGEQTVLVTYASGATKLVHLRPENFSNLYMYKAHTAPSQLRVEGVTQMVQVRVPLPNKEIDRIEQTEVYYYAINAPVYNGQPTAIYEVYFVDGTHCTAMYNGLTTNTVGNITDQDGIVYFNSFLPNGDEFISCIINTADQTKVHQKANLEFVINNLKDSYDLNETLGDDITIDIKADGEVVGVSDISEAPEFFEVSAFDTTTPGNKELEVVLHRMFTLTFPYSVKDANGNPPAELKVTKLEWVKVPKYSYEFSGGFDKTSSFRITMSDGSTQVSEVSDKMIPDFDPWRLGVFVGKVLYGGKELTYNYEVIDTAKTIGRIEVNGATVSYKVGDKFDNKGTATIYHTDPTEFTVPLSEMKITGFDTATAGTKTVTVTYRDKTATFQINVTAATSGGGTSSGGSGGGGGGGGATTPAKPAEPAKQAEQANKPAIPGTTQLSRGDIKITKFDKVDAENIKQITGFLIPSNKIEAGLTLPEGMKAVKVEGAVKNFKDVKNHWAADSINRAVELGLLNGMTTDSYAPKASLTAEQTFAGLSNVLMKHDILNLKMDKAKVQEKLAGQLANQTWSTLATAQVLGNTNETMLSKYSDPKAVKNIVTRGEMANIIFALAGDVFPSDAKTAEEFCKQTGIMVGDANGNFAADRVLSRAELASILLRVDDKISEL